MESPGLPLIGSGGKASVSKMASGPGAGEPSLVSCAAGAAAGDAAKGIGDSSKIMKQIGECML